MKKEDKPLSEEGRNKLFDIMDGLIKDCTLVLTERMRKLCNINQQNIEAAPDAISLLETHASVLYVIIETAIVLRADFRSRQNVERRAILKYMVFATHEFYKPLFHKNGWNAIKNKLSKCDNGPLKMELDRINSAYQDYKKLYFDNGFSKTQRDIVVHYDTDIEAIYKLWINVNEENEVRRAIAFLEMAVPMNNLLGRLLPSNASELCTISFNISSEEKSICSEISKKLPKIEANIDKYADSLDLFMRKYSKCEYFEKNQDSLFDDIFIDKIKVLKEIIKPIGLVHFLYLDIAVTLKGYVLSENYIEGRWHLLRLYLIIYEGCNKLFGKGELLKNIANQFNENSKDYKKIQIIEKDISTIMQDEDVKNTRETYAHLRKGNKFYLFDLIDFMCSLKAKDILDKALYVLGNLNQALVLSRDTIKVDGKDKDNVG